MDYYQILGVSRHCDRHSLHKAFRELSKKSHPDRFDESSRPEAEKRYKIIVKAFNTLKDPKQREKYDKTLRNAPGDTQRQDPDAAAMKCQKAGLALLNQKDYEGAVDRLNRAVYYREDAESYYLKGTAESHLPTRRKDAVASLQKAIELNPKVDKYYVGLARALLEFGLTIRAHAIAQKGLTRFPQHPELSALARASEPEQAKKPGLFGGLFGKKGD